MYTMRLSSKRDGRSGGGVFGLCSLYEVPGVALAGECDAVSTPRASILQDVKLPRLSPASYKLQ